MYDRIIKRFFDLLLGIVALPFLGIAVLVIAPLVKHEDKGPAFYNSPRVGRHGKSFTMYKFRTMFVDAPDFKMPDGSAYNAPDDPRMTRIGTKLRKTSMDELPQVLNIIRGEMSFIGPRPDLEEEAALYVGDESRKLEVRPGISGYAQVYGRNAITWRERLALDVEYVERIGFLLDVRIFLRTFAVVFSGQGVYVAHAEAAETVGTTAAEQFEAPALMPAEPAAEPAGDPATVSATVLTAIPAVLPSAALTDDPANASNTSGPLP